MKIAIESSTLLVKQKTGVELYVLYLLKALAKIDSANTYYLVYLAFLTKPAPDLGISGRNFHLKRLIWIPGKVYNAFLRTPFGIPIDLVTMMRPDVFLFPNFVRWPLIGKSKSITIVYDTSYLDYPEVSKTRHFNLYLKWAVPRSIHKSTLVVAISESTKQSIVRHYKTPPEKIRVVTPAIDHSIYKPLDEALVAATKKRLGIEGRYLLYVGTLEPRKNIVGILEAYRSLHPKLTGQYKLVLAGGKGWGSEAIEAAASTIDPVKLIQTGYVTEQDKIALYSGATLFIYPAIFEGWGMPVVEAMACGSPVITAGNSSLPEAGGDAAIYVKSGNQQDLNEKLANLLSHPNQLNELRQRGLKQADKFTWEQSAQKLLDAIKEVEKLK